MSQTVKHLKKSQLFYDVFGSFDEDSDTDTGESNAGTEPMTDISITKDANTVLTCKSPNTPKYVQSEQNQFVKQLQPVDSDVELGLKPNLYRSKPCGEKLDGTMYKEKSSTADGDSFTGQLHQQSEESIDIYSDLLGSGDSDLQGGLAGNLNQHRGKDNLLTNISSEPCTAEQYVRSSGDVCHLMNKDSSANLSSALNDFNSRHRDKISPGCSNTANPVSSSDRQSVDPSKDCRPADPLPSLDLYSELLCDDVEKQDVSNEEVMF